MNTNLRSPAPALNAFNTAKNVVNNVMNAPVNVAKNVMNNVNNRLNAVANASAGKKSWLPSFGVVPVIVLALVATLLALVGIYYKEIGAGFESLWNSWTTVTPPPAPVTKAPTDEAVQDTGASREFVEKVLPGRKEVFNVSSNKYTYYDAEPLCKALGAELATYEQVKSAYDQGADWCNYGWVKGQMAVYPTQKTTWEHIQNGPEDQRNACGKPGMNGGYFDNPELRFGVTCYGEKPPQKDHDADAIAAGQGAPLTPGALDFEKRVAKFRGDANSIGILPFNKQAWSN